MRETKMLDDYTKLEFETLYRIAMEINATTKHDVFIDYAAHIKGLRIRLYENGWSLEREPKYNNGVIGAKTAKEAKEAQKILKGYL